jgi:hypothetical protein
VSKTLVAARHRPPMETTAQFMYSSLLPSLFCHDQTKSAFWLGGASLGMGTVYVGVMGQPPMTLKRLPSTSSQVHLEGITHTMNVLPPS